MEILNIPRGRGKTTYLIFRSHVTGYPILCTDRNHCDLIQSKAKYMDIEIPAPISVKDYISPGKHKSKVLVDEGLLALSVLLGSEIDTVTMSEKELGSDVSLSSKRQIENA